MAILLPVAQAAVQLPSALGDAMFYLLAFFAVFSALKTALTRNIVHAAIALFFTLVSVAGLYALMTAYLLAVVQMLVYAGGILMVLCFAVMLTGRIEDVWTTGKALNRWLALVLGLVVLALLVGLVVQLPFGAATAVNTHPDMAPHDVGRQLLQSHVLPFEALSVLLLAALVGAVAIVRKEVKAHATAGGSLAGADRTAASAPAGTSATEG